MIQMVWRISDPVGRELGMDTHVAQAGFMGCFAGLCMPSAMLLLFEAMPAARRGAAFAAASIAVPVGWLWTFVGLNLLVTDAGGEGWRRLFLWSAFPPAIFLVLGFTRLVGHDNTVTFLFVRRRGRDLVAAINAIADLNGHADFKLVHDVNLRCDEAKAPGILELMWILWRLSRRSQW